MRRFPLLESAALVAYALWAVVITWPLTADLANAVPGDIGDPLEYVWLMGWGAHAITAQPLALLDSNMFFPLESTLVFSENLLGLAIPLAPLTRLTGNPMLATNVAILGSLALASCGVRRFALAVGASASTAALAGLAFAVAPYRVASVTHVHVLAIHLLPFALLAYVRAVSRPSITRLLVLAAVVGAQFWTSLTGGAMTVIAVGLAGLASLLTQRPPAWRPVALAGVATVGGIVLASPLLLAYRAAVADHPAYAHPRVESVENSATPAAYLHPHRGGGVTRPLYEALADVTEPAKAGNEKTLFPGVWLTLASVVAALCAARTRDDKTRFALVLGGLLVASGFVLSLGPRWGATPDGLPLPYALLSSMVSGLGRVPARFGVLVVLGLAIIAGVGLAALRSDRMRAAVLASAAILALEAVPSVLQPSVVPPPNAAHRSLASTSRTLLVLPTLEYAGPDVPIAASAIRETIPLWFSTAHYRPMTNGYGAFLPESYQDIATGVQTFPSASAFTMLRRLGVDTVVVETGLLGGTRWEDVPARLRGWPGAQLVIAAEGTEVWDVRAA